MTCFEEAKGRTFVLKSRAKDRLQMPGIHAAHDFISELNYVHEYLFLWGKHFIVVLHERKKVLKFSVSELVD